MPGKDGKDVSMLASLTSKNSTKLFVGSGHQINTFVSAVVFKAEVL